MDANGGNPTRITFGQGRYASPVWSPRGDLIAYTKINGGRSSIGVIRLDGTGERTLSEAFHVEGPTWAPNGRVLMFFGERPSGEGIAAESPACTALISLVSMSVKLSHRWTHPILLGRP